MRQITLSKLALIDRCSGAAALPWVREMDVPGSAVGHALHQVQEHRTRDGSADLDAIAERWELTEADRGRFFYLATRCRPEIPAGALAEVSLAYESGVVLAIPNPDRSHTYDAPGAELCGTVDVMWAEPEPIKNNRVPAWMAPPWPPLRHWCPPGSVLWVVDYKTGDENNVAPIRKNLQLRASALLAARWTGAQRVIPAICFLDGPPEGVEIGQGRWEVGEPLGPAELDEIEAQIRDILRRAEGARLAVAAGEQPELATGSHCVHCPARTACPAHLAEVRAMIEAGGAIEAWGDVPTCAGMGKAKLSAAEASYIAERLPMIERAIEKAKEAIKAHVDAHGPIALSDGKEYGAREEKRTEIDPGVAFDEIAKALDGAEGAAFAAFATSKGGIKTAVQDANVIARSMGEPTRKVAPTVRAIMADIKAAGGLTETTVKVYKARHPKALDVPAPAILEDLGPLED